MKKHNPNKPPSSFDDPVISVLHSLIKFAVRILAILMVLVIFWGVADVVYVLYQQLSKPPIFILTISDLFKLFAAFLVVLIAIEIFQNITLYLRSDVIPLKLVVATALMAISRKIIIIDFNEVSFMYILASATVVISLGITYFLIDKNIKFEV